MPPATSRDLLVRYAPGHPGATPSAADHWHDLWHHRELFAILAWRDIAVRYKQTVIGVAWAVVRPFADDRHLHHHVRQLAKLPTDGACPTPLLVFAGMLPWFLFSSILTDASNSLISNANLISKVYFPRLIIPRRPARWPWSISRSPSSRA